MRLLRSVPALPVRDAVASAAFYRDRLGFHVRHEEPGFAVVWRDDVQLNLWQAGDEGWAARDNLTTDPVCSGAESFLAGTASCRIEVDDVDAVYDQMRDRDVLHYADRGSAVDTDHGTREFAVTDRDNNLLEFFTTLSG